MPRVMRLLLLAALLTLAACSSPAAEVPVPPTQAANPQARLEPTAMPQPTSRPRPTAEPTALPQPTAPTVLLEVLGATVRVQSLQTFAGYYSVQNGYPEEIPLRSADEYFTLLDTSVAAATAWLDGARWEFLSDGSARLTPAGVALGLELFGPPAGSYERAQSLVQSDLRSVDYSDAGDRSTPGIKIQSTFWPWLNLARHDLLVRLRLEDGRVAEYAVDLLQSVEVSGELTTTLAPPRLLARARGAAVPVIGGFMNINPTPQALISTDIYDGGAGVLAGPNPASDAIEQATTDLRSLLTDATWEFYSGGMMVFIPGPQWQAQYGILLGSFDERGPIFSLQLNQSHINSPGITMAGYFDPTTGSLNLDRLSMDLPRDEARSFNTASGSAVQTLEVVVP